MSTHVSRAGPVKLAARRYAGTAYSIWFDDAARSRLQKLHSYFADNLGLRPTNSVVIRAALKALEQRISDPLPATRVALKADLVAAAEGVELVR